MTAPTETRPDGTMIWGPIPPSKADRDRTTLLMMAAIIAGGVNADPSCDGHSETTADHAVETARAIIARVDKEQP